MKEKSANISDAAETAKTRDAKSSETMETAKGKLELEKIARFGTTATKSLEGGKT